MWNHFDKSIFLLALALFACGETTEAPTVAEDGEDDSFLASTGKADADLGACTLQNVMVLVNATDLTVDGLKSVGVHTRAAKSILAFRAGPDGQMGTGDDQRIVDLEALDKLRYVGPAALRQIVKAAGDDCGAADEPSASVIFSPQPYETSHLAKMAELIDGATTSIDIAMYSFRDARISAALGRAVDRGVPVRLVFESANAHRRDPAGTSSAALEDLGVDVRWVNKIMHHKFAIYDGPVDELEDARTATLATSSGNWSNSAGTRFDENTVIMRGHPEAVLRYQAEFNLLWENSRPLDWNPDIDYYTTRTITDADIAAFDEAGVDAVYTSANFRTYVSNRNGPTFSGVRGMNAASDKLVELIGGAQTSVHIASGHLRSRPISEALAKLHQDRPDVDIRIYLDGQEYISDWYHNEQVTKLATCLEAAGDNSSRRSSCLDKGFYFGYQLHQAGIQIRYKYYAYRWDYTYADQMHNKFTLVDGRWLATGSYNYSDNAEHNTLENVLILDAASFPKVVRQFEEYFERLWATQVEAGDYERMMDALENTDEDVWLVFDAMSLDWDQVTALKGALRAACPDVNSAAFRDDPGAHRVCER